jgi:hypothetical protein
VHSDDAPTVYVTGHPGATDPAVRKLERDAGAITVPDPYVNNGSSVPLTVALADETEMRALHMVNADPARTPTFTLFANPDFFLTTSNPPCGANPCVAPGFAWNHGDIQEEIGNTWVGIVGPGVVHHGLDAKTWTDHTNVRPTMLALARLKDGYVHDGRVLLETLAAGATPKALQAQRATALQLSALYEQLNAPFGTFCLDTLAASTKALESTDESRYASLEASIAKLTASRNFVAGKIKTALDRAAFKNAAIRKQLAAAWLKRGRKLLADAAALKGSA